MRDFPRHGTLVIAHRAKFGDRIVGRHGRGGGGPRGLEAGELLEGDQRRLAAGVVVAVGVGVDVPVRRGRERDLEPGAVARAGHAGNQAAGDFDFGAFGLESCGRCAAAVLSVAGGS